MRKFRLLAMSALAALGFANTANADHLTSKYLFAARINGAQEVPAVTTNALGVGTFYLNGTRDTMCIKVTVNGLSSPITGAHIHNGMMGTNGPVLLDLGPFRTDSSIMATITGATLTEEFVDSMFQGRYYINIHTANNPSGEIRGQILPEEDWGFRVRLDGAQEVPNVVTNAEGLAFFMLAKHKEKMTVKAVFKDLSGPITGIHLHAGAAGENGSVVMDLMPFLTGNTLNGTINNIGSFVDLVLKDSVYLNVHTAANPNGEIRGQLTVEPYLHYDAMMNGAQEVPAVSVPAMGVGVVTLNYTFDTAWYDVMAIDLTGNIQAAHFHNGALGANGPVVYGIPMSSTGADELTGMITGTDLSNTFVNDLNTGSLYLNIHTAANTNGEIRGQVYRTFREGYTYKIDGMQEVPMVTTDAYGSGMVSVDRDQTNAHVMAVVTGITPTGIHFHNQVAGQNGPVIYDLTSLYSNGGVYTYWTENDANTPFNSALSNKFRKDSVYINFHTAANMNGEIRGDVSRSLCLPVTQNVQSLGYVLTETKLYPVPAGESATLDVTASDNVEATIVLADMMGRTIWSENKTLRAGANRTIIPLNGLATGVYFVRISNENGQMAYKLIKQ